MSKHEGFTPGPWLLQHTGEHGCHRDVTGTGGRIGATCQAGRIARVDHIPASWGNAEANAALIADAPRLYAENQRLREAARSLIHAHDNLWPEGSMIGVFVTQLEAALTEPDA